MPKINKLQKGLGVFALVMINVVAVDSLRTLPFSATFGSSLIIYYVLASLAFFLPVAFVAAELATGWPDKGGIYVWVREAFGERMSFVVIWLQWVYNIVWYPTILSFIAGAVAYLIDINLALSKTYMLSAVMLIFWGATLLNLFGMKLSSWVSMVGALLGALVPMGLMMVLAFLWLVAGKPLQIDFSWHSLMPDMSSLKHMVFLTAVLFGLIGMELSATHADEVRDPGHAFPKAIFYSTIIIFVTLVFSSLAIAMVVPQDALNLVTGVEQAFGVFLRDYHVPWMDPIITAMIILGGVGTVAAWIIGPTKGLLVAARDGSAPKVLAKVNRFDVPYVILILQALIFTALCSVFLLMDTVSESYWLLTAMTAQLAMFVYIAMFAAAIYLRYKCPDRAREYRIPFGNLGIWIAGLLGIASCVFAIYLGFVPPSRIVIHDVVRYEEILVLGMLALSLPPFIMYQFTRGA